MVKLYNKVTPVLLGVALALSGCGGGGSSSDSTSGSTGTSSTPTGNSDLTVKYGEVQYDLTQAFQDYKQAIAELSTSSLEFGVVYNDRQKLLIDANGDLINFVLRAEPANTGSICKLNPVKVTLDADYDNFELERIGYDELYLLKVKGLPLSFNEATCEYREGGSNEQAMYLVNKDGSILEVIFDLDSYISYQDREHNRLGKTVAIASNGDVYSFELDESSNEPKINKLASTGRTDWKYVSTEILSTEDREQRFLLFDYLTERQYSVITNDAIKNIGIGIDFNFYYQTYDDSYVSLVVDRNQDAVLEKSIDKETAVGIQREPGYSMLSECKVKNVPNDTIFSIYNYSDESLFSQSPQELKSEELIDSTGKTLAFTCRSTNGRYLAIRNVTSGNIHYLVADFGMKTLFWQPTTQLIGNSYYTKAGDDSYTMSKQTVYKIDVESQSVIDLNSLYHLGENQWVSNIRPIKL